MKYLLIIFAVLLFAPGCGPDGCEHAGGGTVARKPTDYRGAASANMPYIETGKIHLGKVDGDNWAGLRPCIHNPTDQDVKVKIACQYWLDGVKLADANPTKFVTVRARASRTFEGFDLLFTAMVGPADMGLAARCTAEVPGYPTTQQDAAAVY